MNQGIFQLGGRLLRRDLRRAAQKLRYRRLDIQDVPALFANSFPKSGTHLLTQVLHGFTRLGPAVNSGLPAIANYKGDSGALRSGDEILADLERLRAGDIAYGHLHATAEVVSYLSQQGFATYFLIRDPRDVVVSHVHYVTEMAPKHVHHQYYREVLPSFDQRLHTSIVGRPDWSQPFLDIGERFQPYLGWLEINGVLTLRYEDLINDRNSALGNVVDFAVSRGFSLNCRRDEAILTLDAMIKPQNSPTFRQGKSGGWREYFTSAHKAVFKEVAGDLLVRLGYEENYDW